MSGARPKGLWVPGVVVALAFSLLCGLGVWQLQRLATKEWLLAAIAERSHAAPVAPPEPAEWASLDPQAYDYRHVTVTGTFLHDREMMVFRIQQGSKKDEGGPGFLLLTPLRLNTGAIIIVNRGFVPQHLRSPATRLAGQIGGEVVVTGLMRPPEPRNAFTPADDPDKNTWYTRDAVAMAAALKLTGTAPFTIDADTTPNPGGWPQGGFTMLTIRNDHLSYALTWFGLALTLIGVFGVFAWRQVRG